MTKSQNLINIIQEDKMLSYDDVVELMTSNGFIESTKYEFDVDWFKWSKSMINYQIQVFRNILMNTIKDFRFCKNKKFYVDTTNINNLEMRIWGY